MGVIAERISTCFCCAVKINKSQKKKEKAPNQIQVLCSRSTRCTTWVNLEPRRSVETGRGSGDFSISLYPVADNPSFFPHALSWRKQSSFGMGLVWSHQVLTAHAHTVRRNDPSWVVLSSRKVWLDPSLSVRIVKQHANNTGCLGSASPLVFLHPYASDIFPPQS